MIEPLEDLDVMINPEEWACEVLLWPGRSEERAIMGVFDQPTELVDMGGEIAHVALSPILRVKSSDVEGIRQGDALQILPCPRLGIAGGAYRIKAHLPDGHGLSTLELMT